jgi:glutathione S-transferase
LQRSNPGIMRQVRLGGKPRMTDDGGRDARTESVSLDRLEPVVAKRGWLAGSFCVADILMADVLRLVDRFEALAAHPATRDYLKRATARPAFVKAHADPIAHFAEADT